MIKKVLLAIFMLISTLLGFSQTSFIIDKELILNDYYYMSIVNIEKENEYLYVTCRVHEENNKPDLPMVYKIKDNLVISKTIIKPDEEVFISDIKVYNNRIYIEGGTPTSEEEEMQDYLAAYTFNGVKIWSIKLEKKYEGIFKTFLTKDYIEVLTQNSKAIFYYQVNLSGKISEKRVITSNDYVIDIYKDKKSNFTFLFGTINSNGDSEGLLLTELNSKLAEIRRNKFKTLESFIPDRLIKINSGFVVSGNLSSDRYIPYCCYVDSSFNLISDKSIHYEPDHYMFKSSFQMKDILFDKTKDIFLACGVTKVINDDSNILFTFNNQKIFAYKILDKTSLWGNNCIIMNKPEELILATDYKISNDFDTKIKVITFKIK